MRKVVVEVFKIEIYAGTYFRAVIQNYERTNPVGVGSTIEWAVQMLKDKLETTKGKVNLDVKQLTVT